MVLKASLSFLQQKKQKGNTIILDKKATTSMTTPKEIVFSANGKKDVKYSFPPNAFVEYGTDRNGSYMKRYDANDNGTEANKLNLSSADYDRLTKLLSLIDKNRDNIIQENEYRSFMSTNSQYIDQDEYNIQVPVGSQQEGKRFEITF